jgi:hypothetical protein
MFSVRNDERYRRESVCVSVKGAGHPDTHLLDVINHNTPANNYSDDNVYPVYFPGQVPPPLNGFSLWFTLTVATLTLKQLCSLLPLVFESV